MDQDTSNLNRLEKYQQIVDGRIRAGFYSHVVEYLLRQPPVKTEPVAPPDESIPPSPYIPLAHR
jgi:hypothetical protein